MANISTVQEIKLLFKMGAHLGHKKNRLHPKARKYVYKILNGVSIIDLTKTVGQLTEAKKILQKAGEEGKVLLIVATKKIVSQYASELAKKYQIPYITNKWLPGLLTNFDTLIKNVKKLENMKMARDNGEWDQYVKHERTKLAKELTRLEKLYGGLINLNKKPDILLIWDTRREKNAVKEAKANQLPIIACVDTNSNPDEIKIPIVINDDTAEVANYVLTQLIDTYAKNRHTVSITDKSKQ